MSFFNIPYYSFSVKLPRCGKCGGKSVKVLTSDVILVWVSRRHPVQHMMKKTIRKNGENDFWTLVLG